MEERKALRFVIKVATMAQMKDELRQFDVLCNKRDFFSITSGCILAFLCLNDGVKETIDKHRWYAQISDCIIRNDTDCVR